MIENLGTARPDLRPPGIEADERTTLLTFLDYLREAVAAKLAGLTDEQARTPGVESGTSPAWLVKHLAAVERNWFGWAYAGQGELSDDQPAVTAADTVAALLAEYRAAVAAANAVALGCTDLSAPGVRSLRPAPATAPSMRWVLVHMVEETARHAGHADILREHLDGATGR